MNRIVPKIGRAGHGRSCLPPIAHATPAVAVGVAAVHLVSVVEVERDLERRLGVGAPFEDFLRPVHPQIIVHPARENHLFLRGVPERVVGLGGFELARRVEDRPRVAGVLGQCLPCPLRAAGEPVVVGVACHEVDRQLAADDQLFEVGVDALSRGVAARGRPVAIVSGLMWPKCRWAESSLVK